jgi:hypothetical protein
VGQIMIATREDALPPEDAVKPDCTLIWIDAREAVVVRWHAGDVHLERFHSDVPSHHKATGHVRYDPTVRHGGGAPKDTGEANRLEHLTRFVDLVAGHVPPDDALVILGPGTVRDRLAHRVRETDRHASRTRSVTCEAATRLTDRQLVARARRVAGEERRRTVGAYRWTQSPARHASGSQKPMPRRVGPKPRVEIEEEDLTEEEPG